MDNDGLDTRSLSANLASLRGEFEAAAGASRQFGSDARKALGGLQGESRNAERAGRDLGRVFTKALGDIAGSGKSLNGVLQSLAVDLAKLATENILGSSNQGNGGLVQSFGRLLSVNAKGNVFDNGRLKAFAKGGVLSEPTFFPMRGGAGLAGEAGPEAILPLRRGADGRLGVASGGGQAVTVNFNVTASDVASFKRSESQIAAMLQRSLNRGVRNL